MTDDVLDDLIENWRFYCTKDQFIGLGSTRKVYRVNDFVIKVHLNGIGYAQSKREQLIYDHMKEMKFRHLFAAVHHVNEQFCVQDYYNEVPMDDHQSFDIDERRGFWEFPKEYDACLKVLDEEWDAFDMKDSSNYGINENKELILIDYGMSKTLYEQEWVPAAERGEIPQIEVHRCTCCGVKKEIRMYGDNDLDIRCIACGKE